MRMTNKEKRLPYIQSGIKERKVRTWKQCWKCRDWIKNEQMWKATMVLFSWVSNIYFCKECFPTREDIEKYLITNYEVKS